MDSAPTAMELPGRASSFEGVRRTFLSLQHRSGNGQLGVSVGSPNNSGSCRTVPLENLERSERVSVTSFIISLMLTALMTLLATLSSIFRSRAALELENLALRHQIGVLRRAAAKRLKLASADRLLWICLSRLWRGWRSALTIVKPETVIDTTDRLGVPHRNRQRRGSTDSRSSLPAGTALRWSLLAGFPGPHERQPLEYGSVPVRVGNVADPLGPGGHGSMHASHHWVRRRCRHGQWSRTLSDVQPHHSRALLVAEVPELRQ
jgi:hypothetical protein